MKRREFLASATAAASLPLVPLSPALAKTATPLKASQVGWAALFARVNDRASPALLQKWMGVGAGEAQALMSELVSRNIVHAPIAGSAKAIQPMYSKGAIPGIAKSSSNILKQAGDLLEKVDRLSEPQSEPQDPEETSDEAS